MSGRSRSNETRSSATFKGGSFFHLDVTNFDRLPEVVAGADAVVHLAALPGPHGFPPEEVFRNNVLGTYRVVQACRQLDVHKVVLASGINAIGLTFNVRMPRLDYLPLDKKHPARPEDAYSLSKLVGEQVADAATRLEPQLSVASLRLHGVVFPDRRASPRFPEAAAGMRDLWGYVDIRDAVAAFLRALEASFSGHEVFFICARDTGAAVPTAEPLACYYPRVPLRRPLGQYEGLFEIGKAARLLGWTPQHSWR